VTIPYDKPHATYAERVAILRSRGLMCDDEAAAVALLKTVGYYRLSAYVYPFRLLLDRDHQQMQSPVSSAEECAKDVYRMLAERDLMRVGGEPDGDRA